MEISRFDLNKFQPDGVELPQGAPGKYVGFYMCENGEREIGSLKFVEWMSLIFTDGEKVWRYEVPINGREVKSYFVEAHPASIKYLRKEGVA